MANELFGFLVFVCLAVHICTAAENLDCAILKDVFKTCSCRAATEEKGSVYAIVDCSNQFLTEVPTISNQHDKTIYKLILRDNKITKLSDNSFQGLKVEYLDLTGNSLVDVAHNTFLSMENSLVSLEIDGDSQSLPPIEALKKLKGIENLTLRHYNVPFLETSHNFFLSFSNLKSLTLDDWKLSHIESSTFLGLDKLQTLNLVNQQLENLPIEALADDPFDNLVTLKISHTLIKRVTQSVFKKLTKLKNLDLSNNEINELEESCFMDVEDTLQSINLQKNFLNNENGKLAGLVGMEALKKLDLSGNNFETVPKMPKLGTKKPFNMLLQDNEINNIQANAFVGYAQNLNLLDLKGNLFREINENSFEGVDHLITLFINDQGGFDKTPIQLPSSLLNSASTLQELDLSGQLLDPKSLWHVIPQLTSLRSLNLKHAELNTIPDFSFQHVVALERLDVSFNSLSELNQNSFYGAQQLKELYLVENNLKTIPSCLFHGFESTVITLTLAKNPIICDCKIDKLLKDIKNGRIKIDSSSAKCLNGALIQSTTLDCSSPIQESCKDYPTTTENPVTAGPVTIPNKLELELEILDVTINSIKASWTITDDSNVEKYALKVTSTANNKILYTNDNILSTKNVWEVTKLPDDTLISVCVTAFQSNSKPIRKCRINKTDKNPNSEKQEGSDSAETGIIVGCVVGGVALIGIVVAIIILLVFRKKPKKIPEDYVLPTQPRNFAKAELPSMTGETRSFTKQKKNGKSHHPEKMQVVAISDGQTSPGARVGRANMMFQPEDGYEPMDNFKKMNGGSLYENDHGGLPPTPGQDSIPPSYPVGYYNEGFREDKYDQVEVEL